MYTQNISLTYFNQYCRCNVIKGFCRQINYYIGRYENNKKLCYVDNVSNLLINGLKGVQINLYGLQIEKK